MKRRSFMASSLGLAFAGLLQLPTAEAQPVRDDAGVPSHYHKLINEALAVAGAFDFTLREQASFFALDSNVVEGLYDLPETVRKFTLHYENFDVWKRIDHLLTIQEALDRYCGRGNTAAQRALLAEKNPLFGQRTLRDMMTSRHWDDLEFASRIMIHGSLSA